MKHPTGYAKPRRLATPRKKVRLDLKRRPEPEPDDQWGTEQKSNFGKWVGLVALLHVILIGAVWWIYENAPSSKPPEEFISLLPAGDTVKGTPGAQQARKLGPTTAAPVHHAAPAASLAVRPSKPVPPKPPAPPPMVKTVPKTAVALQPVTPAKPAPPKPPKVKVDLTLADAPSPVTDKPKPKVHHTKPAPKPSEDTDDQQTAAASESTGLSREQIAAKLGDKVDESGIKNSVKTGESGSINSHQSQFAAYYLMIAQQVDDQWQIPNVAADMTSDPVVHIFVEKDGRVPPESVYLVKSSGNATYDDSAVSTAKNFGYLRQPLPDGCPPDISINFKPSR